MNEITYGSVKVTARRLMEADPLFAASRQDWPQAAGALGWQREKLAGEEPLNPFCGIPTDHELDACIFPMRTGSDSRLLRLEGRVLLVHWRGSWLSKAHGPTDCQPVWARKSSSDRKGCRKRSGRSPGKRKYGCVSDTGACRQAAAPPTSSSSP